MSSNGMSSNGLSSNGMISNGLSSNGLSSNGLATATFASWWSSTPTAPTMMSYIVKCALASGKSLSYTDSSGKSYTWPGNLGLAPVWASGKAAPPIEQQLISACLAAHVNKFGINIQISVRGQTSTSGVFIPVTSAEASQFDHPEGCFFGNLFTGAGAFAASSQIALNGGNSPSARARWKPVRRASGCQLDCGTCP